MDHSAVSVLLLRGVRIGAAAGALGLAGCTLLLPALGAAAGAGAGSFLGPGVAAGAAALGAGAGAYYAQPSAGSTPVAGIPGVGGRGLFGGFAEDIGNLVLGGALLLVLGWVALTYLSSKRRHGESQRNRDWLTQSVRELKEKLDGTE